MTTKRYPESKNLSRSQKPRRPRRLPDHYAAAQPPGTNEEHPVDVQIDHMPGMAARRRKLAGLRQTVQRQVHNQRAFITYEDARLDYTVQRERFYFNLGFKRGHLAGLANACEVSGKVDPAVRAFAHQVCMAVGTTKLPKLHMAAALLDVARAIVLASREH